MKKIILILFSLLLITGCAVVDESKVYSYDYEFQGLGLLVTKELDKKLESPKDLEFYTLTGPGSNLYYMDTEQPVRFTDFETNESYIHYNTKMYSLDSSDNSEPNDFYKYYYRIFYNEQLDDYRLELINEVSIGNAYGVGITENIRTFNYYFDLEAEEQRTIFLEQAKPIVKIIVREYDTAGKLMFENEYKEIEDYKIKHHKLELEFHETNLKTDEVEVRTYEYLKSQMLDTQSNNEDSPFGFDNFKIKYFVDDGKPYARIRNLIIN